MNISNQNWLVSTLARIYGWRRLRVVLVVAGLGFLLFAFGWKLKYAILIGRPRKFNVGDSSVVGFDED